CPDSCSPGGVPRAARAAARRRRRRARARHRAAARPRRRAARRPRAVAPRSTTRRRTTRPATAGATVTPRTRRSGCPNRAPRVAARAPRAWTTHLRPRSRSRGPAPPARRSRSAPRVTHPPIPELDGTCLSCGEGRRSDLSWRSDPDARVPRRPGAEAPSPHPRARENLRMSRLPRPPARALLTLLLATPAPAQILTTDAAVRSPELPSVRALLAYRTFDSVDEARVAGQVV